MEEKQTPAPPIPGVNYPGIGDLSRFDAVQIKSGKPASKETYKADDSIMIHLTITGRCYARCKGCVNSAVTLGSDDPRNTIVTSQETEPERDTTIIKELANRHSDQKITVCLYGGEPFLAVDKMREVWRILREADDGEKFRFMVYTNGELLIDAIKRYPEFMGDMWLYSISIDGDEEQHNRVRVGTQLSKIKRNLKELSAFYKGNILHWSTLREEQSLFNCFEEFLRLYKGGLVNHFFWHWAEAREPFENFEAFVRKYGRELEQVMDIYTEKIFDGQLLPIAHVNELILFIITAQERGHTACGVELAKNYDIVSGEVYSCADLPSCHSIGELDEAGMLSLKESDLDSLIGYKKWLDCYQCGVHPYCGGRCPVQVLAGSRERTYQYCQLMRLHTGIIQERISDIQEGLRRNGITLQGVYDRSAFLTQYTDVVP
jgi:uncharacterized protein